MNKVIDLTGQKFGRLTVVCRAKNSKEGRAKWHCVCDCGNECDVVGKYLRNGRTRSCGCYHNEVASKIHSHKNKYCIIENYIVAKISNGVEFYVDKDDEWVFDRYCWGLDGKGYVRSKEHNGGKSLSLHRLIMNCPDNMIVDHINGDTLDNRKSNLRIVTQSQNSMNKQIRSNNTSGITGVSYCKRSNNWRSEICVNRKSIVLGYFNNFDDAVSARKSAEEKYFGEYSYDNSRNKTNIDINSDRVVETCEAHDHLIYA